MAAKWVNALQDDRLQLNTISTCVALGDLHGDGDTKLIIADLGTSRLNVKLKVFKGVTLIAENVLADLPIALVPFINEQTTLPSVAVASGPALLIYKNLKPFYKFTVPGSRVNEIEEEAWSKAASGQLSTVQLVTVLENLKTQISLKNLSSQSQTLLLSSEEDKQALVQRFLGKPLSNLCAITCCAAMKKNHADVSLIDVLLVGTERGIIHAIDSQAFVVIHTCQLPGTPVFLCPHGVYDVDFRIFVSTRDGQVYCVKREVTKVEKPILTTKADIIGMTKFGKMLVVACSDRTLTYYTFKGKRLNQIVLPSPIKGIQPFAYAPKQFTGVLVALEHQVRIYNDMYLLDQLRIEPSISWIAYGPLGREEGGLAIGTKDGGLVIKLFRRLAKLDEKVDMTGPVNAHNIKLNIPKKTKTFVDQTMRERESAVQMHQAYQRDLFMLRFLCTSSFHQLHKLSLSSVAVKQNEAVDIAAEVHGFGPTFRLTVRLSSSAPTPLTKSWLSFIFDPTIYRFDTVLIPVSLVMSGHFYTFSTLVHCVKAEQMESGDVRILLCKEDRSTPVVTAILSMPVSEMSLLD